MLGREDLITDSDFVNAAKSPESADKMEEILTNWMEDRTREEVFLEASSNWMLPVAPVLELHEVLADPQYNRRGLFQEIHHPVAGTAVYPSLPYVTSDTIRTPDRAPLLGEHTEEILGR
jgi:formyl-CoA transferase